MSTRPKSEKLRQVVSFVGIRQRGARNFARNAHVAELAVDRSQADFDIPQTLAVRQLSECETKDLLQAGESPEFIIAALAPDAFGELVGRNVIDQLREDHAADMHGSACPIALDPSLTRNSRMKQYYRPETTVEIENTQNTSHPADQEQLTSGSKNHSRTAMLHN